jgi:hypothetical protein
MSLILITGNPSNSLNKSDLNAKPDWTSQSTPTLIRGKFPE